jgi:hydrogenase-4 component F
MDVLSLAFAALIFAIGGLALLFSLSITPSSERQGRWSSLPSFFMLPALFCASMLVVVLSRTFIGIWIGISGTTLATTFLVGYSGGKTALEAAWKYLMLCSFGIAIALIGMLVLARAALEAGIPSSQALSWSVLATHPLPAQTARIGVLLMLLGFATKAGLVPMHAWLPDAHSKAPAAVSALLSGLLVSCSLYAIVRTQSVAATIAPATFDTTLFVLGALSVLVASLLMLTQRDLKRLLSYSTIEHSGLVAIALSLGTPFGLFAALYHVLNHALSKSAAFFSAGIVQHQHGTTNIGMLRSLATERGGRFLLASLVGLGGIPPFGIFFSELLIVLATARAHRWLALGVVLAGLLLGFAALARLAIETGSGKEHRRRVAPALASLVSAFALAATAAASIVPFLPELTRYAR